MRINGNLRADFTMMRAWAYRDKYKSYFIQWRTLTALILSRIQLLGQRISSWCLSREEDFLKVEKASSSEEMASSSVEKAVLLL